MAVSTRILALTLITAAAVGAGDVGHGALPQPAGARAGGGAVRSWAAGGGPAHQGDPVLRVRRRPSAHRLRARRGLRRGHRPNRRGASSRRCSSRAPEGLVSALPPGTALRGLFVGGQGDAYVDFSGSLRTNHPGGSSSEILTVYAIVSALTVNLPAITSRADSDRRPRGRHARRPRRSPAARFRTRPSGRRKARHDPKRQPGRRRTAPRDDDAALPDARRRLGAHRGRPHQGDLHGQRRGSRAAVPAQHRQGLGHGRVRHAAARDHRRARTREASRARSAAARRRFSD